MNRLNLIFISADPIGMDKVVINSGDIKPEDITPDMQAQLLALESALEFDPSLANDPSIKPLLEIKAGMDKAFNKPASTEPPAGKTQAEIDAEKGTGAAVAGADVKTGLEALPFFGGAGATATDFKGAKLEQLPEIAAKAFNVDTKAEGWFEKFLGDFATSGQAVQRATKAETELAEFNTAIQALPKELQTAIKAVADGKDWRTVFTGASAVDMSNLTIMEKYKAIIELAKGEL